MHRICHRPCIEQLYVVATARSDNVASASDDQTAIEVPPRPRRRYWR